MTPFGNAWLIFQEIENFWCTDDKKHGETTLYIGRCVHPPPFWPVRHLRVYPASLLLKWCLAIDSHLRNTDWLNPMNILRVKVVLCPLCHTPSGRTHRWAMDCINSCSLLQTAEVIVTPPCFSTRFHSERRREAGAYCLWNDGKFAFLNTEGYAISNVFKVFYSYLSVTIHCAICCFIYRTIIC